MAKVVALGALSHSPLLNGESAEQNVSAGVAEFRASAQALGALIAAAKPDVLIVAGPDHFRSLFYANMPAFCIGAGRVTGWGDWDTISGEIPSMPAFARHVHRSLLASDFDPSASYDMPIDHGLTQPLELCDIPSSLPIVPIIVNANAPPRPSLRRCYALGVALRNAVESYPGDLRVAAIGSGGLSHTPPAGDIEHAPPAAVERLIHGAKTVREDEAGRVEHILSNVATLARGINPEWDRELLARLGAADGAAYAAEATDEAIDIGGGNGGHEVRTWFVMAGMAGKLPFTTLSYAPIPELITGMAVGMFG